MTDLFCRLETNDEFKLHRSLYWQISRFRPLEDLVHVYSRKPIAVSGIRPIGHETTLINKLLLWVNSRQPVFAGKLDDPGSRGKQGAINGRHNRAHLLLLGGLKGRSEER